MNFEELSATVQSRGSLHLLRAWAAWRGERLLPLKAEINLRDMAEFLPSVALVEVIDADMVRMRVAGTALRDIYGMEMTGRNLREITDPGHWPVRSARYGAIVSQPCGSYYRRFDTLPDGKTVSYEAVALPLDVDADGRSRQMISTVLALEQGFSLDPPPGSRAIPMPTTFTFVDIGAGLPAVA